MPLLAHPVVHRTNYFREYGYTEHRSNKKDIIPQNQTQPVAYWEWLSPDVEPKAVAGLSQNCGYSKLVRLIKGFLLKTQNLRNNLPYGVLSIRWRRKTICSLFLLHFIFLLNVISVILFPGLFQLAPLGQGTGFLGFKLTEIYTNEYSMLTFCSSLWSSICKCRRLIVGHPPRVRGGVQHGSWSGSWCAFFHL